MRARPRHFAATLIVCLGVVGAFFLGRRSTEPTLIEASLPADPISVGNPRPKVILWFDSVRYPVKDATRIEIIDGKPTRPGTNEVIPDVVTHINEAVDSIGAVWVVVTPIGDAKLGDVVAVIDASRRSRVRGIVLNQWMGRDPWKED